MRLLFVVFFSLHFLYCFAQNNCNSLDELKTKMDSVDHVLQQHKGNINFVKDSIVPYLQSISLFGTPARAVLPLQQLFFDFDDAKDTGIITIVTNSIIDFAKRNNYYIKNTKSNENEFSVLSVFMRKSDEKSLMYFTRGSRYNTSTKILEKNKPIFAYKWKYYAN